MNNNENFDENKYHPVISASFEELLGMHENGTLESYMYRNGISAEVLLKHFADGAVKVINDYREEAANSDRVIDAYADDNEALSERVVELELENSL